MVTEAIILSSLFSCMSASPYKIWVDEGEAIGDVACEVMEVTWRTMDVGMTEHSHFGEARIPDGGELVGEPLEKISNGAWDGNMRGRWSVMVCVRWAWLRIIIRVEVMMG